MAAEKDNPLRNVLMAVDGSEHAMAALQLLKNLPLPKTCKITVLTVLIPRNAQYYAAREVLLEQIHFHFQTIDQGVETHLLTGYPAEQIIKFSKKNKPGLIVLGAKGLRGTLRILLACSSYASKTGIVSYRWLRT